MENKERIMQCAEELFYSRGYDAAGVQEIVDRAGVTKPTLYYYFGSKRGLLEAIFNTKFEQLMPRLESIVLQPWDIREKLYTLADTYYEFFSQDYRFSMLMMALFYSARENEAYQKARPYYEKFYRTVVKLFDERAAELGNMNGRQGQFAISYIGVLNQYLTMNFDPETGKWAVSPEQMHGMVDQFMYGIFT